MSRKAARGVPAISMESFSPEEETRSGASGPLRVLVLDDREVVRAGLLALLDDQAEAEVVAVAGQIDDAVSLGQAARPEVALVGLPALGAAAFMARARGELGATVRFVVLLQEVGRVRDELLAAGAHVLLDRTFGREELVRALCSAARPRGANAWGTPTARRGGVRLPLLSPRELEILRLVARGDRNRAIAGRLRVAESTVKSHLASINGKLGVSARTAAVTAALGQGLLRLDA